MNQWRNLEIEFGLLNELQATLSKLLTEAGGTQNPTACEAQKLWLWLEKRRETLSCLKRWDERQQCCERLELLLEVRAWSKEGDDVAS